MKKRLGISDSLGALMSMCPTTDHSSVGEHYVYNREFQTMLEGGLDEEISMEEFGGEIGEKKRRLSVKQVKALEKRFEVENKLEPENKVKLALELGLHPRQVAIWFQNRRARSKTKNLDRDYSLLKSNFDALNHNCDALRYHNEALFKQIQVSEYISLLILSMQRRRVFDIKRIKYLSDQFNPFQHSKSCKICKTNRDSY